MGVFMKNNFNTNEGYAHIYLKDSVDKITGEVVINLTDLERVREFPNTWRLQKIGDREEVRGTYSVKGVKRQTTLAKWILNFPSKPIFFVDGNTLNNKAVLKNYVGF